MRITAKIPRSRVTRAEIYRILDAAGDSDVQAVSFTGGEPFLFQEDLIQFIEYTGRVCIPYIRAGTNGFIFRNSDRADFYDRIKVLADRLAATCLRNLMQLISVYYQSIDTIGRRRFIQAFAPHAG